MSELIQVDVCGFSKPSLDMVLDKTISSLEISNVEVMFMKHKNEAFDMIQTVSK